MNNVCVVFCAFCLSICIFAIIYFIVYFQSSILVTVYMCMHCVCFFSTVQTIHLIYICIYTAVLLCHIGMTALLSCCLTVYETFTSLNVPGMGNVVLGLYISVTH